MLPTRTLAAAAKGGGDFMSLKQFMLRCEGVKLYRAILRQIHKVNDPGQRADLHQWARSEFEAHKHHTDENTIRGLLMQGQKQLRELEQSIDLSRA